jgi:hypothetical protein
MKSSSPNKIRARPPAPRNAAQALADLEKVKDWTEQPAKTAASAISAQVQAVAPAAAQKPPAPAFPWEAPGAGDAVKLVNFKIPLALYLKLKYLGDTTFGASMTSIVTGAMEKEVDRLLSERAQGS